MMKSPTEYCASALVAIALGLAACEEGGGADEPSVFADVVVDAPGATGEGIGDPDNAVNGVLGAGDRKGGTDVFSLGYDDGADNYVTLRWSSRIATNGPGADFAVFENPFSSSNGAVFMDLAVVQLSRDGETWVDIPYDYVNADESVYSSDPDMWIGFAGRRPVFYNEESNEVDPFDAKAAGGDHFDLDDLPEDGSEASAIREKGFAFIRLVAAPSLNNPDTAEPFPKDPISNGADIDGVAARYLEKDL